MLLGITDENTCECMLCDWKYKGTGNVAETKMIEHLKYSHCRLLLDKYTRKKSKKLEWRGPRWNYKFLEGK
jgi:hypothetical protein